MEIDQMSAEPYQELRGRWKVNFTYSHAVYQNVSHED